MLGILIPLALGATAARAQDAGVVRVPSPPGAAAQDLSAPGAPAPERLRLPGLPNLAHVEKGIYRGGRPRLEEGGAESLARLGIKQVIDLQGGDLNPPSKAHWPEWARLIQRLEPGESPRTIAEEAAAVQRLGAEFVNVPLDSLDPITDEEAAGLLRILERLAASSAEAPVYVHCEHGKDRTGLVLALYRVRYDGWSPAKAAAEMADMGHSGHLDELFTGNMDLLRVLALHPTLQ